MFEGQTCCRRISVCEQIDLTGLPSLLVAELIRHKPAVIVAATTAALRGQVRDPTTIPIVFRWGRRSDQGRALSRSLNQARRKYHRCDISRRAIGCQTGWIYCYGNWCPRATNGRRVGEIRKRLKQQDLNEMICKPRRRPVGQQLVVVDMEDGTTTSRRLLQHLFSAGVDALLVGHPGSFMFSYRERIVALVIHALRLCASGELPVARTAEEGGLYALRRRSPRQPSRGVTAGSECCTARRPPTCRSSNPPRWLRRST